VSVPARFVGAWQREYLAVDGCAVVGIGRTIWIEAGGTYVDVRAPGTIASNTSFGGRSGWRPPHFTWHHDIDLDPRPDAIDRAELTVVGDRIVERGFGLTAAAVPYVEHWHRLPTTSRVTSIAAHEYGLAVRVGTYAAALLASPRCACCWEHGGGRWRTVISLGPVAELPEPSAGGWALTRGWYAR